MFTSEQRLTKLAGLQRCAMLVSRVSQDGHPVPSVAVGLSKRSNNQVLGLLGCAKSQEKSCSARRCLWTVWYAAADAAACLCRVQAFVQGVEEGHEYKGDSVCWSGWPERLGVPHSGSSSDHRRQGRRQHQSGRKNNSSKKQRGWKRGKRENADMSLLSIVLGLPITLCECVCVCVCACTCAHVCICMYTLYTSHVCMYILIHKLV